MSGLGYTLPAVVALIAVIALELAVLRTGLFGKVEYWISMGIVVAFQVIVDGWLTKLSAPIVIYDEGQITGVRVPWDIPVEDYLFGFSMITLTLVLWVRLGDRGNAPGRSGGDDRPELTDRTTTQETP